MSGAPLVITPADPALAVLAWALTEVLRRTVGRRWPELRRLSPAVAVLVAVGLAAALEAGAGEPIGWPTVVRGLGAGAAAVLGHDQLREILEWRASRSRASEQPSTPPGASRDARERGPDG